MNKIAYPNEEQGLFIEAPHNLHKWMQSMQYIYGLTNLGMDWNDSFLKATSNWNDMEKQDFKKWIQFYQENAHHKYKIAQLSYSHIENGGSFIPNIEQLRSNLPSKTPNMSNYSIQQDVNAAQEQALQKEITNKKIQALIGRLNSAEKLATHPQVQVALKRCLQMSVEDWVAMLQKLKREIQLAPMRNSTASLIDDILYKNANQILSLGNRPAAIMLIKVAQMAMPSTPGPATPGGITPMNPIDVPMAGQPIDATNPSVPSSEVELPGNSNSAVTEFINNLNNLDQGSLDDDSDDSDDINVAEDDFANFTVTAQVPPMVGNVGRGTPVTSPEVSEAEIKAIPAAAPPPEQEQTGDRIDLALSRVGIPDIVSRLEGIASMFKNREIARQLSIIDLMMDKVGIAPFFPTLAEAMRSALESNQYCQSRIEDILAKLRGTMSTPMSEHMEGEVSGSSNTDAVKTQLAKNEIQERARKEKRKQLQEQEENAQINPQPNPGDLAGPAQVQTAPPIRPVV